MENPASGDKSTDAPHPAEKAASPSSRESVLDVPPGELWADDTSFTPDPFTAYENGSITMVWKGSGSSAQAVTASALDPLTPFPVFGGDGTYQFDTRGTPFPVEGAIGEYIIYLGQVGGSVRGTVNVRKRTEDR